MWICSNIHFFGSFAQPKCDRFLEWINWSLYHTLERNGHQNMRDKFLAQHLQSCLYLSTTNKNWLRDFCLKIILIRFYNMTSLEKSINLGYLFLTLKPPQKTYQYLHHFLLHVLVCFNLFRRLFLTPIHVT